MKKTTLKALALAAILVLPSQLLAGTSTIGYQTDGSTVNFTVPGSSLEIRPSNKVTILLNSDTADYGVIGAHLGGDRQFGTDKDENKIYWKDTGTVSPTSSDAGFALDASTIDFTAAGWSAY